MATRIHAYLYSDTPLVFDPQDIIKLRTHHRIIGRFFGSFKSALGSKDTWQWNAPLALSPMEAVLAVQTGFLRIYKRVSITPQDQRPCCTIRSGKWINMDVAESKESNNSGKDDVTRDISNNYIEFIQKQGSSMNARCAVYRQLWNDGFYISDGTLYGSDFIVYRGDPVLFHSRFAVIVIEDEDQHIAPNLLVSATRSARGADKDTVYASIDSDGNVNMLGLHWMPR